MSDFIKPTGRISFPNISPKRDREREILEELAAIRRRYEAEIKPLNDELIKLKNLQFPTIVHIKFNAAGDILALEQEP